MDQTANSIDRLDRSIVDLRTDMDKRFVHFEDKIDKRFIHFEEKIDQKFVRIEDLIDRKFCWSISIQITSLLATIALLGKLAHIY